MEYKECYSCRKTIPKNNKGIYCPDCKNMISESKKQYSVKQYTQKVYNSQAWRSARIEALKRSEYRCEICDAKRIVKSAQEVHHIIKVADGDNSTHFNLDNLVCVCDKCHDVVEDMTKVELIEYLEEISQA